MVHAAPADHPLDAAAPWPSRIAAAVTLGFAAAIAMWVAWFLLHMPATVDLVPQSVSGPALLLVAAAGLLIGLLRLPKQDRLVVGSLGGLVTGLVTLLILGTRLTQKTTGPDVPANASELQPQAGLMIVGFLIAMTFAGVVAGFGAASAGGARARRRPSSWLSTYAVVNAAAILPLLTLGGLVTSAKAGFAVPDWPGTYGANMFLYPIGLMSDPRVFLEHTHRLFGAMVGLTTLTGLVFALLIGPVSWRRILVAAGIGAVCGCGLAVARGYEAKICIASAFVGAFAVSVLVACWASRSWRNWAALGLFVLVCVQGVVGGVWTQEKHKALVLVHGVVGQIYFALTLAYATALSEAWRRWRDDAAGRAATPTPSTSVWVLLGLLLVQLVMGTMARHLGSKGLHALYTHMALSIVIMVLVTIVGTKMMKLKTVPVHGPGLKSAGHHATMAVGLQFLLGWVALLAWMTTKDTVAPAADQLATTETVKPWVVLVRTAHQANGALVLGTSAAMAVWALARLRRP